MAAEMECEQVRELAPELALDIAGGEERHAALRHLSGCSGCRQLVSELLSVGEDLLLLAPAREPPPGFESRVLAAVGHSPAPRASQPLTVRRRWVATVAVAASVIVAAAVGGGSVFLATAGDRRLAEGYRAVLSEGQGTFFAAAPLRGSDGRVGTVFGYEGRPSWVMATLQPPSGREGVYRVQVVTRDGRYLALGEAVLGGDRPAWGRQLPRGALHGARGSIPGAGRRPGVGRDFRRGRPLGVMGPGEVRGLRGAPSHHSRRADRSGAG